MKTSSVNEPAETPSLQTARGFVATNIALPGFGSLMAKRAAGWPQAALTVIGFGLTVIFGVRFALWFFRNIDVIYGTNSDPLEALTAVWAAVRWALLGIGLFGISWLWALTTNAAILRSARRAELTEKPPILN